MSAVTADILIVDDNEDHRELLAEFLRRQGCSVTTASNGAEALHQLEHAPRPTVVLLDLEMPILSGWQVLATVGQNPELASLPIIVVSGASVDFTRIPAAGHCRKPVDLDRLREIVARIVSDASRRSAPVVSQVVTTGVEEQRPGAAEPLAAGSEDAPAIAEREPAAGDPAPAGGENKIGEP